MLNIIYINNIKLGQFFWFIRHLTMLNDPQELVEAAVLRRQERPPPYLRRQESSGTVEHGEL
jgi:hypothetical protein